jgi:hypothetical protein
VCLCPVLRPRQDRRARPCDAVGTAPALPTTKAPTTTIFRGSIARLRHSLSTLRRTGYPAATQDSLPAAGRSTGRDWLPAGFQRKVSELLPTSLPPFSSFPGAMERWNPGTAVVTSQKLWSTRVLRAIRPWASRSLSRSWPCSSRELPLYGHGGGFFGVRLPCFLTNQVRKAGHLAKPTHSIL